MKNSYRKALEIAKTVHHNQYDLSGQPYILHPLYVANNVKGKKAKIVALLHDVLEDGDISIEILKRYFSKDVCNSVLTLTRSPQEPYFAYIERVKKDPLAKQVKIKDLEHNMTVTRLKTLTVKDFRRLSRYLKAYKELTDE